MKLFKSLLVAPATLGLLAPMSATANEVTISDFNAAEEIAVTNSRLDGLESRFNNLEAGSFSETTTASFGSTFYVGALKNAADSEAATFTYDFGMGLATSFTGEDSFDVAIIGGNANTTAVDGYMGGDGTTDVLTLDGVSYTFPLGDATVIVGDGVGVDDLNTGACAYSAFTDTLGDCAANNVGGSADSGFAISYDFGNGFTLAGGAAGGVGPLEDSDETDGYFTAEDASTIGVEAAYTADTYGLAVAYTDDEATSYWTINGMYAPEGFPSLSVGYESDTDDANAIFVGLTWDEVGPGSVSLGMASTDTSADDFYQYELSYAYPLNDGMTITPGAFISETAGDSESGIVVTTSFSF